MNSAPYHRLLETTELFPAQELSKMDYLIGKDPPPSVLPTLSLTRKCDFEELCTSLTAWELLGMSLEDSCPQASL